MINFINKIHISYVGVTLLLVLSIFLSTLNGCVDIWSLTFNNKILYILNSLIGTFSIIMLFKNISNQKRNINILNYFGVNSLIIMSTHQILLEIINKITGVEYYNVLQGIIVLITILILEMPVIILVNKRMPWIIGNVRKRENMISTKAFQ